MNKTTTTTCKLLTCCLLSTLFFYGCAPYRPQQPVYYPPPPPKVYKPTLPEAVPVPESAPGRQTPRQTNPIAADFSRQADEQVRQGRSDLAAATLERGLRIAPKEAMLWSQLAEIKLQQQQYLQARSLAAKSNSLAGSDTTIVEKNHWIITQALKKAASQQ